MRVCKCHFLREENKLIYRMSDSPVECIISRPCYIYGRGFYLTKSEKFFLKTFNFINLI